MFGDTSTVNLLSLFLIPMTVPALFWASVPTVFVSDLSESLYNSLLQPLTTEATYSYYKRNQTHCSASSYSTRSKWKTSSMGRQTHTTVKHSTRILLKRRVLPLYNIILNLSNRLGKCYCDCEVVSSILGSA